MAGDFFNRKHTWTPKPRPEWLARFNREGAYFDLKSLVPLDENGLLNAARANTGLSDFGSDDWHEPFQILIRSLDEEAQLNLMGRLMTRSDLIIMLEARLRIEDTYNRHPEIQHEEITAPFFIIGQGRSGTSFLLNLLASHPDNGAPRTWEAMFPCPPPETSTYGSDPRIARANALTGQLARVVPEHGAMYEYAGHAVTENAQLHCLLFQAPAWFSFFQGQVPAYASYMQGKAVAPIYQFEKKVLKLLQWRNPRRHWVLKSPICIMHIPEILEVYPDARFIWPHRDPIKALASAVNLGGTLFWSKSDHPFIGDTVEMFTNADISAAMMTQPIQWLASGLLPGERLCNIQYNDLVREPLATVQAIYDYFGMPLSAAGRYGIAQNLADHPRTARPVHQYHAGSQEQLERERASYALYQRYFQVPSEI